MSQPERLIVVVQFAFLLGFKNSSCTEGSSKTLEALATTSKCGYTTHIYTTAASHRNDQPFRNAQNLHDAVVVQPDVFLPQRAVEIRVEPEARSQ